MFRRQRQQDDDDFIRSSGRNPGGFEMSDAFAGQDESLRPRGRERSRGNRRSTRGPRASQHGDERRQARSQMYGESDPSSDELFEMMMEDEIFRMRGGMRGRGSRAGRGARGGRRFMAGMTCGGMMGGPPEGFMEQMMNRSSRTDQREDLREGNPRVATRGRRASMGGMSSMDGDGYDMMGGGGHGGGRGRVTVREMYVRSGGGYDEGYGGSAMMGGSAVMGGGTMANGATMGGVFTAFGPDGRLWWFDAYGLPCGPAQ